MMYIFFCILLYLFLHNPVLNIFGIGLIKFLYIIAPIFFLFNVNTAKSFKKYKKEFLCFSLLIIYILLRVIVGAESSMLRSIIVALIESLILPIFIVQVYIKYLSKYDFYRIILIVGSIGALISTLAFFNPDINFVLRNIQLFDDRLLFLEHRGFGLSEGLTFSYSIVQAIILYVGINQFNNNKWFLFIIPMMLISIAFNARIGILLFIVALLFFLLKSRGVKSYIYILLSFGFAVFVFNLINFENQNSLAFEWVQQFFYEVNDFFLGTELATYSTADTLFKKMIVVPDNLLEWILGQGETMFGVVRGTDLGYLQKLNYGGVVLLFLYALLIFRMSKRLLKYNAIYFLLFFLSVILISEIKGNFIPNSGGFRLMFLLYVFIIESRDAEYFKVK